MQFCKSCWDALGGRERKRTQKQQHHKTCRVRKSATQQNLRSFRKEGLLRKEEKYLVEVGIASPSAGRGKPQGESVNWFPGKGSCSGGKKIRKEDGGGFGSEGLLTQWVTDMKNAGGHAEGKGKDRV